MGTYNSRMNTWKTTQLTIDHKPNNPNENRRILFYNGRIDRMKNDFEMRLVLIEYMEKIMIIMVLV